LIAVFITFSFHLQPPYWSGMTVLLTANLYTGSVVDKAIQRIVGTIIGALIGYYCAGLVANSFMLLLLLSFLIITISVYYYHISDYGYAFILGALCAFLIIAQLAIAPENAFFVAIWRPVEIGIGVLVAAFSAYCIFPNQIHDSLVQQVDGLFANAKSLLQQLERGLKVGKLDAEVITKDQIEFKKGIRKALEGLLVMGREIGVDEKRVAAFRFILNFLFDIGRQLHFLLLISKKTSFHAMNSRALFKAILCDLQAMHRFLVTENPRAVVLKTKQAIAALQKQIARHTSKYPQDKDFAYALLHFFQQVNEQLVLLHTLLSSPQKMPAFKVNLLVKPETLRYDTDLIKYSIKSGLSVVLALLIWLMSGWPAGINGIISSLLISIRKHLYDMSTISLHRLLGCIVGGGLFITALFFVEFDVYVFFGLMFIAVWGFSYWMFKQPQYAYIGLQANIALIISLAQEGGPPVLLSVPLQRFGGIVIGIMASFMVANLLWRSDAISTLQSHIRKIQGYQRRNLKQLFLTKTKQKTFYDLMTLFGTTRGIIEAMEALSFRDQKEEQFNGLKLQFEALLAIQAILGHLIRSVDTEALQASLAKSGCDVSTCQQRLVAIFSKPNSQAALELSTEMQARIELASRQSAKLNEAAEVLTYLHALYGLAYHFADLCSLQESHAVIPPPALLEEGRAK
jgi:p-hydroxybenzoic acid efflux pump subunit AaeB